MPCSQPASTASSAEERAVIERGVGDRQGVLARRDHRVDAGRGADRGPAPDDAHAQGVHRARDLDLPRRGRLPVPSHPDPRCRVPRRPKGDARRPSRALCRLARADDRRRSSELDEILGYHLEQAFQYRSELGPVSDRATELAARAGERLGRAGRRAMVGGGDVAAAASLMSRAAALLPEERPLRRSS